MRRGSDDPFDDIFREIERMMQDVMGGRNPGMISPESGTDDTHIDIHDYDDQIKVIADVPGVTKEDFSLQCDGRVLSIKASSERKSYDERVQLPALVDEHSATAKYNNGVLEITFDRADETAAIDVE